jgi:hypothetical protein
MGLWHYYKKFYLRERLKTDGVFKGALKADLVYRMMGNSKNKYF